VIPTEQELDRAAAILRHGGLVALPTETVYGLGANALDPAAVQRIFEVKGRPQTSPLIVHVASIEMARSLAAQWPIEANVLAGRYWPGPLTIVVRKRAVVPDIVTAGLDTVGLRMPSHPVALAVIRRAQLPVAAPSANRFTELSPTTAEHVRTALGDAVDLILDGGPCPIGIESTVLSLAGEQPLLLRPGMISREEIEALLERPVACLDPLTATADGPQASPGLFPKHYSPRTPTRIVSGPQELPPGRGAYLWRGTPAAEAAMTMPMPAAPADYARVLYHALHQADQAGLDWIAIEKLPDSPEWAGIRDRIQRAATLQ
jgi:L-threonylcarbamoyladenylate synthase